MLGPRVNRKLGFKVKHYAVWKALAVVESWIETRGIQFNSGKSQREKVAADKARAAHSAMLKFC